MVTAGIIVARQSSRKRKITAMTITMAAASVLSTSRIDSPTAVVESNAIAYCRPGGKLFESSARAAFALRSTSREFAIRQLLHADAHRVMARVLQRGAITFGAHLRVAHVFQLHQAVRRVLDDDVVELLRVGEPAHDAHGNLEGLFGVGGRLPQLSGRNLDILLLQSVRPRRSRSGRAPPAATGSSHTRMAYLRGLKFTTSPTPGTRLSASTT